MKLDYKKLLRHIVENPSPVYLFSGEEDFLKGELIRKLMSEFNAGFGVNIFYAGENPAEEILSAAMTVPFASGKKLVLVKSAEKFSGSDREKMLSYFENPSPDTLVLLEARVRSGADSFFSKVAKLGVEINFRAMYENEIIPWLMNRARVYGKRLLPKAAYELKEQAGRDLRVLANELEKLLVKVGERGEITLEDVKATTGESRVRSAFEFADAISGKKKNLAFRILSSLIQQGKTPPEIIGILAWQFRRIWLAKCHSEKGMKLAEITRAMKIPHFSARGLVTQAKKFSDDKLNDIFTILLDTDIKTKTGESSAFALELLVIRLCEEV